MSDSGNNFKQVMVILSTGRTGTQALAHNLNDGYDQVCALHEPKPVRHLRVLSNYALAGHLTRERKAAILRWSRQRLLSRIPQPVYIESNWFIYGFLDVLEEIYGLQVKVVHVVRDPRSFIPSYLNFGTFRGVKWLLSTFCPYWYLRPEQYAHEPAKRWRQMTPVERLAWHWLRVNTHLNQGAEMFGDRYRLIRYEDLFTDNDQSLRQLIDWLELPPKPESLNRLFQRKVNASRDHGFPAWEEWLPEDRRSVLSCCGELMQRYGYAPEDLT